MTDAVDETVPAGGPPGAVLPPLADPGGGASRDLAAQLIEEARAQGLSLVGPGGLLADITKRVLEAGTELTPSERKMLGINGKVGLLCSAGVVQGAAAPGAPEEGERPRLTADG